MSWRFDHLAFNTDGGPALPQALAELLGLQAGRRPPFPFPGRWLYQDGQALVHVIEQDACPEPQLSHIAFSTLEAAATVLLRVQASGLEYQVAQVPEDGIWQIFVRLPGGLVLELDAPAAGELAVSHDYARHAGAPD
ncbi:hypothetical protein LGQ10_01320 [Pseudomonas sp. L5B5]|uniref:hypothetical protein n=1 Tax=Pseudomonas sp. L5B5 TaxID=2883205 RepID=UPI000731B226|nr:hypothetical protein [Pseudomonas sp. L5B5]KTC42926.1 hypothetical protein AO265_39600 [Pseudomonas sp. ABAC61]UCZ84986.1 hypothetical protein LGQ10_01320 [Pseudomonas sp. L5B5]